MSRIATEPKVNPTTALLYGAATAVALGLLGFSVLIRDRLLGTMLVLMTALAGLAHPISRWLAFARRSVRRIDRPRESSSSWSDRRSSIRTWERTSWRAPGPDCT